MTVFDNLFPPQALRFVFLCYPEKERVFLHLENKT